MLFVRGTDLGYDLRGRVATDIDGYTLHYLVMASFIYFSPTPSFAHLIFIPKRVFYSWVSSAISTIGQQSRHQGTYVVEEQLDPFSLVADELSILANSLRSMVIAKVPKLASAAELFFKMGVEGKRFRPTILLLMATALNIPMSIPAPDAAGDHLSFELRSRQRCIAEITEMIHKQMMAAWRTWFCIGKSG